MTPRLLNEEAARIYLGGLNPLLVMPPCRLGKRRMWDRLALDRRLDELFGVERDAPAAETGSALDRWKRGKAGGADGA